MVSWEGGRGGEAKGKKERKKEGMKSRSGQLVRDGMRKGKKEERMKREKG